jgi:hypothetical protein
VGLAEDTETLTDAIRALKEDAGCEPKRARDLVEAVGDAAAAEAMELIAGRTQSVGSALDRRVATLERVIRALPVSERLPNRYEVGAIFRITPTQGANVLRTYQARYSEAYRERFASAVAAVKPTLEQRSGTNVFVFAFNDPALLEYAVERLRRRGLTRSVTVDQTKLELVVDRDVKDRFGKSADAALKEA